MDSGARRDSRERTERERIRGRARISLPARAGRRDLDGWWRSAPEPQPTIVRGED
jgi:hypothetical protein